MGAESFTSPPKEGVLQIVITLKNPSPRPCGKHTNHYTTEATLNLIKVLELCTVIDLWKVLQFCEVHFKT